MGATDTVADDVADCERLRVSEVDNESENVEVGDRESVCESDAVGGATSVAVCPGVFVSSLVVTVRCNDSVSRADDEAVGVAVETP